MLSTSSFTLGNSRVRLMPGNSRVRRSSRLPAVSTVSPLIGLTGSCSVGQSAGASAAVVHSFQSMAPHGGLHEVTLPRLRTPVLVTKRVKHSVECGMFSMSSVCPEGSTPNANLDVYGALTLAVGALNTSLTQSTWDKYDTAV